MYAISIGVSFVFLFLLVIGYSYFYPMMHNIYNFSPLIYYILVGLAETIIVVLTASILYGLLRVLGKKDNSNMLYFISLIISAGLFAIIETGIYETYLFTIFRISIHIIWILIFYLVYNKAKTSLPKTLSLLLAITSAGIIHASYDLTILHHSRLIWVFILSSPYIAGSICYLILDKYLKRINYV